MRRCVARALARRTSARSGDSERQRRTANAPPRHAQPSGARLVTPTRWRTKAAASGSPYSVLRTLVVLSRTPACDRELRKRIKSPPLLVSQPSLPPGLGINTQYYYFVSLFSSFSWAANCPPIVLEDCRPIDAVAAGCFKLGRSFWTPLAAQRRLAAQTPEKKRERGLLRSAVDLSARCRNHAQLRPATTPFAH